MIHRTTSQDRWFAFSTMSVCSKRWIFGSSSYLLGTEIIKSSEIQHFKNEKDIRLTSSRIESTHSTRRVKKTCRSYYDCSIEIVWNPFLKIMHDRRHTIAVRLSVVLLLVPEVINYAPVKALFLNLVSWKRQCKQEKMHRWY